MKRRMLWLTGTLVLLLVAGAVALYLGVIRVPQCRRAYEQIETGMTVAQVEAILGGPAGNHDNPTHTLASNPGPIRKLPSGELRIWMFNEGRVEVKFDTAGTVHAKAWFDMPQLTPLERIGDLTGLW